MAGITIWYGSRHNTCSDFTITVQTWKHTQDVKVKKGYSWSEQLGIAIACLVENDQRYLVDWIKEVNHFIIYLSTHY